jgi:anaerobic selenocysteine-containing dehydrogenase
MSELTSANHEDDQIVLGACQHDCPDNCAMISTVRAGKVVSVRGNPDHPFTRGVLCAKVKSFEKRVYAPDRILHPLQRAGRKGQGRFERISWDAALHRIAERFQAAIDADGAESILPCSYLGSQGLLNGLHVGDPFFNRLGASIGERTFCNSGASKAFRMVCGPTGGLDPESFEHAKLIVLWGINILSTSMHHWPFIERARKKGAVLVVIDPLESRTARRADWHIRVRPGTDVVLALALIHQLVADGLVDRDYIAEHTVGFGELERRAAEYPADLAAHITGVEAQDILRLAKIYGETRPTAIRTGVALERTRSGPDAVRAVAALPAITGAWRHVGGGMFQHPGHLFPIDREKLACPHLGSPSRRSINLMGLADALTQPLSPPVRVLFVYNSNPVTAAADQNRLLQGLARDDLFTVVSEIFPTDATDYADIVLPATSQVEQLDLMYSWGHFNLQLNMPAIAPLGEAVSNTELFRRLARQMGFDDPALKRTDMEILRDSLDWSAPQLAGISLELLRERGFARLGIGNPAERLPHARGNFPTPSGKCELASSSSREGGEILPVYRQGYAEQPARPPVDPLPGYRLEAPDERHPYLLLSPKSHFFLNSGYANIAYQAEAAGPQRVLVHPDDARDNRVSDGEPVQVFNDLGQLVAIAKVTAETLPGVVVVPHGHWRKASAGGVTVNALVTHRPTSIGCGAAPYEARVGIRPAPAADPLAVDDRRAL